MTTREAASRSSPFSCPIGLALATRQRVGSIQPNTTERWWPEWDPASELHFAIRDGFAVLAAGGDVAGFVANHDRLTHSQRRFVRHALEQLQTLSDDASANAGVDLAHDETELRVDDIHVRD